VYVAFKYRIKEIAEAEKRKHAREEARNSLEGFVYRIRDLSGDETFVNASTASERSILAEKLRQTEEWLWAESDRAMTKDLRSKRYELEYVLPRPRPAAQSPSFLVSQYAIFFSRISAREQETRPACYDADR
jgi:hypothetical protein